MSNREEYPLPLPTQSSIAHLFLPRNTFNYLEAHLPIPTSFMHTDLTFQLSSLVNFSSCLNILDERKEYYRGHCDVIRMMKGEPCLWMVQSAVQCPGSSLPYIHKLLALDFPSSNSNHPFASKKKILEWATNGMLPEKSALVFDSHYSPRSVVTWLSEKKFFFFTSLNKKWWDSEWRTMITYIVNEGDTQCIGPVEEEESDEKDDDGRMIEKVIGPVDKPKEKEKENEEVAEKKKKKEKKVPLNDLEQPLKDQEELPQRVAMAKNNGSIISMHWHRERNRKSKGVRAVVSNAFRRDELTKKQSGETAIINTFYASLFDLGSDSFNRFLSNLSPSPSHSHRPPSSNLVFSDLCHRILYLNIWSLQQQNTHFTIPSTSPAYGPKIFAQFLESLALGLWEYADTLPDTIIRLDATNSGCGCDICEEYKTRHDLTELLKREKERSDARKEEEEKKKQKEEEHKKKEERKRERELKKKDRHTYQIEYQREYKRRKTETTRQSYPKQPCLLCKRRVSENLLLKCVKCTLWVCGACHSLKGKAITFARLNYICSECKKNL